MEKTYEFKDEEVIETETREVLRTYTEEEVDKEIIRLQLIKSKFPK